MQSLIDRWTLARKFAILGVLGLALIIAPLVMYFRMSNELIATAKTEQSGIEPLRKLLHVLQLTQQHRGRSAALLAGNTDLEPQRSALQTEVDKAIEAFSLVVKTEKNAKLTAAWDEAIRNWNAIAQGVGGRTLNGKESFSRHTSLCDAYLTLIELTADHFGLTLDPEAAGYHLVIATTVHLPELTEALGQGRARGALALSQKSITVEERAQLAALIGHVSTVHHKMERTFAKAIEANPRLQTALGTIAKDSATLTNGLVRLAKAELVDAEKLSFSGSDYFRRYTEGIDSQFKLIAASGDALHETLGSRIDDLRKMQVLVIATILLAGALAALVAVAIMRSMLRQIGGEPGLVAEVAERVAVGDLSRDVPVRAGDTSSIMASMARMQTAIKEIVAAQLEMKHQHDAGAISYRIEEGRLAGSYREIAGAANELVAAHIGVNTQVLEVMRRYATGDLSVDMESLPGEKAKITEAIQEVKTNLQAINAQIQMLVEAAGRGDFSARGDVARFDHEFRGMVEGLNRLMQTSEAGLKDVMRVLGALANGDLTQRMSNEYQGIFAQLKTDANQTVENLTAIVSQIKEASETIDTASKEISQGNSDLSQRTEEQASSLEETASSMEELTSTVKQNAENARQANQMAVGASDVAVKGGTMVGQVVATMNGISESSRKIADIIGVIDGIAFQTNILALNAAVEAARAGEQGRGFAVVATEVRNLAQRSAAAAKEIKSLIEDSVVKVDTGSKLVNEAGRTMEEIVSSVKRVNDIMAEITAASAEQSSGIEQVNQAITQMDEVTQQNAALVEEAAAAAESMQEQVGSLVRTVATFKLSTAGLATTPLERRGPGRATNVARLPEPSNPRRPRKAPPPEAAAGGPALAQRSISKAVGGEDDWTEF